MKISELQNRVYAPYSSKADIALIKSRSGKLYPGIRIENLSFPLTIPAVQCGLMICLSEKENPQTLYLPEQDKRWPNLDFWRNEFNLTIETWKEQIDFTLTGVLNPYDNLNTFLDKLLGHAQVYFSNVPVVSVLETEQGFIGGVNIEIDAWELGLCAERVALAKAMAYGISGIKTLHLHSKTGEYCSPCGACRQVLIEHLPQIPVVLHQPDGTISSYVSADLLPYNFKIDSLKAK